MAADPQKPKGRRRKEGRISNYPGPSSSRNWETLGISRSLDPDLTRQFFDVVLRLNLPSKVTTAKIAKVDLLTPNHAEEVVHRSGSDGLISPETVLGHIMLHAPSSLTHQVSATMEGIYAKNGEFGLLTRYDQYADEATEIMIALYGVLHVTASRDLGMINANDPIKLYLGRGDPGPKNMQIIADVVPGNFALLPAFPEDA